MEVFAAHPAHGQIAVSARVVVGEAAANQFHIRRKGAAAVQGHQVHEFRAVGAFHVQVDVRFIRFPSVGFLHGRQQAVRHDAVAHGGGVILVEEKLLFRQFFADVGIGRVLDRDHHQIVGFADLL